MKLYMKSLRVGYDAQAEYDVEMGKFVVLKGSVVSNSVSQSEKFRGATHFVL